MARAYYHEQYWSLADEPEPRAKTGSGGRVEFRYGGEWVTDEMIERRADQVREFYIQDAKRIRDREMELDREAAKPFWLRWLGGA